MASNYSAVEGALETRAVPVASGAPLAPPNVVSGAVSKVLALVGLSPFISDNPVAPVPSPAMWAMLAWVRRQSQQTLIDETPTVSQTPAQSSQTVDDVVTGNTELSAPVAVAVATAAVVADPPALVQVAAVTPQTDQSAVATAAVVADPPALVQVAAVTPQTDQSAVATAAVVADPPALVQVSAATPQTDQSSVAVTYTGAQVAGDTNILAIGWNNTTSTITSVTDSAGNPYQLAVPTARGAGLSQAIYYAPNIKAAAAGTNTVTVTFNTATPYVDVRALEYSGLDPVNPFDVGTSAAGTGTSANSGTVTTTAANALIFGAGMTIGFFSTGGTNFTTRIITTPDADIAEDRIVTATGAYSATAPLGGSAAWVMQVATFRAASTATAAAPPYPASVENRKILDQNGDVYLMRTFSSWGMAQQLTPAEITTALEAVAANGFNAVTVWIGGGADFGSGWNQYTNANGDGFWTGTPWASGLGEGWSSVDWIVQESARHGLTVNLSFCESW